MDHNNDENEQQENTYLKIRKQLKEKFLLNHVPFDDHIYSARERYVFIDDLELLLKRVRDCYLQSRLDKQQAPKVIAFLTQILQEIQQLLQAMDSVCQETQLANYQHFLAENRKKNLAMDSEQEKKWQAVFAVLDKFAQKNYQICINENIKFITALDESNDDKIKNCGYQLQQKICSMYRNPNCDLQATTEILQHSNGVINDPIANAQAYQAYANTVEGKPLKEHQALGYAMRAFGYFSFAGGWLLITSIALVKPTFGLTTLSAFSGFGATWGSTKLMDKGSQFIEEGRAKKLSRKMTLFGDAVRQASETQVCDNDEPLKTKIVYGV